MPSASKPARGDSWHAPAWREHAPIGCLGVLVVLAPQMLGGAVPQAIIAIAALSLVTGVVCLSTAHALPAPEPLTWAMLGTLAWTIVQAVPLPCGLIGVIDATNVEGVERTYAALGEAATWCTLSRSPGGTRTEVVKGLAIVAAFVSGALLTVRGKRRSVYWAVGLSVAAMALVTMGHAAVDAQTVFGLYRPTQLREMQFVTPLVNPNALGGFLAMGAPLLLGLALADHRPTLRGLSFVAAAAVAASVVLTRSRGAIAAMLVGIALFAVVAWLRPRGRGHGGRDPRGLSFAGILSGFVALLALLTYQWREVVTQEYRQGGTDKLDLIEGAFRFATEHPWLGVGRGAFASAFASVHGTRNRFDHPENLVAQWSVEWGFPIAALLLLAIAHALVGRVRRRPSLAGVGAIAALLTIAGHNLVDLGLELVGVAVVGAALLGATSASQREVVTLERGTRMRRAILAVTTAAVLACAALTPTVLADDVDTIIARLQTQLEADDREGFRATLRRAVHAHPLQPEPVVLAAAEALKHGDRSAGRWMNLGMQLAPGWPEPHLQAAQWLWNEGRHKQAVLEVRTAAARDASRARAVLCPLAGSATELLIAAAPEGAERRDFLEAAAACVPPTSEAAEVIDAALADAGSTDAGRTLRSGRRLLADKDAEGALAEARAATRQHPELDAAVVLEADALVALSRADEAVKLLAARSKRRPTPEIVGALAQAQAAAGNIAAARAAIGELRGLAGAKTEPLRKAWMLEGHLEAQAGNLGAALRAYEQAYQITGDTTALAWVAGLHAQVGNRAAAILAYSRLCDLGRADACAERDHLLEAAAAPGGVQ